MTTEFKEGFQAGILWVAANRLNIPSTNDLCLRAGKFINALDDIEKQAIIRRILELLVGQKVPEPEPVPEESNAPEQSDGGAT